MEPITPYPEAVSAGILQAIEDQGTSRHAVAERAGMTFNLFKRRLAGHSFTIPEIARIAAALGVEVETLTAPRRAA